MRGVGLLLVLAGCGRVAFDVVDVDAAGVDDAAAPAGTFCGIPDGEWELTPPALLDDANALLIAQVPGMDRNEFDPVFSEDGNTLYVTSDQSGRFLVWALERASPDEPFTSATLLPGDVNAGMNTHFGFQPLASLARGVICASFDGGAGNTDLWLGTFTGTWAWTLSSLSTAEAELDARLTADGLTVYFVRDPVRDILIATRPDVDRDFGAPSVVTALSSAAADSAPTPIGDGIVFATDRAGGLGGDDLWYASGAGTSFRSPVPLTALNSASFDGEPAVFDRGDDCELVFVSTRGGVYNLYRAYVRRASR